MNSGNCNLHNFKITTAIMWQRSAKLGYHRHHNSSMEHFYTFTFQDGPFEKSCGQYFPIFVFVFVCVFVFVLYILLVHHMQRRVTGRHSRWQLYDHNAQQQQQHDASKKRKNIDFFLDLWICLYFIHVSKNIENVKTNLYIWMPLFGGCNAIANICKGWIVLLTVLNPNGKVEASK